MPQQPGLSDETVSRKDTAHFNIESGENKLKYVWTAVTLLWFLLSTYLSHQTGERTAATSQHLARMLGRETWNPLLRKAAHVVVFFVLSLLLFVTVDVWEVVETGEGDWRWAIGVFVWCFVDEATKPLIEGRHFEIADVGLNFVGAAVGILVGMVIL